MPQHLPDASISFPMLGDFTINPPAYFKIGPLTIHWYGVIIAAGFLLAVLYCAGKAREFGLTSDDIFNAVLLGLPTALVFGRVYYVVFEWDAFRDDPVTALYIWQGGLAIYGAILGAVLAVGIYCRVKKLNFFAFLDLVCMGLLIGQIVGRWGNFINREAFGYETDVFCRMVLTTPEGVSYSVHPTFLYESLWNLAGFCILHFLVRRRRVFDGEVSLVYFGWYGLGRMFIEGLRTDSLMIGDTGIRVSQLLSLILCLASVAILLYNRLVRRPDPAKMFVNRRKAAVEGPAGYAGSAEEPSPAGSAENPAGGAENAENPAGSAEETEKGGEKDDD